LTNINNIDGQNGGTASTGMVKFNVPESPAYDIAAGPFSTASQAKMGAETVNQSHANAVGDHVSGVSGGANTSRGRRGSHTRRRKGRLYKKKGSRKKGSCKGSKGSKGSKGGKGSKGSKGSKGNNRKRGRKGGKMGVGRRILPRHVVYDDNELYELLPTLPINSIIIYNPQNQTGMATYQVVLDKDGKNDIEEVS
jgi:hypothetical protein